MCVKVKGIQGLSESAILYMIVIVREK